VAAADCETSPHPVSHQFASLTREANPLPGTAGRRRDLPAPSASPTPRPRAVGETGIEIVHVGKHAGRLGESRGTFRPAKRYTLRRPRGQGPCGRDRPATDFDSATDSGSAVHQPR